MPTDHQACHAAVCDSQGLQVPPALGHLHLQALLSTGQRVRKPETWLSLQPPCSSRRAMNCVSLRFWLAVALGASATCSRYRELLIFLLGTLDACLFSHGCQPFDAALVSRMCKLL